MRERPNASLAAHRERSEAIVAAGERGGAYVSNFKNQEPSNDYGGMTSAIRQISAIIEKEGRKRRAKFLESHEIKKE